jgi:hypothetical protein
MALVAPAKTTSVKQNRVMQNELEVANYLCRVAQVIDLGLHHKDVWNDIEKKYEKATDKAPVNMLMMTYEFTTEFMKDENGNDVEDKPRWHSEDFPVYALDSDLATSTKRMKAFDPDFSKYKGDWAQVAAAPCTVTIGHKKSGKAKIGNVSPPMKGVPVPELKNPVKVFTLAEPDLEIFKSLPQWLQDRITSNLEFSGSLLEALLGGAPIKQGDSPAVEEKVAQSEPDVVTEEDEDAPW